MAESFITTFASNSLQVQKENHNQILSRVYGCYIDDSKSSAMAESLTSHQYKSYIVNMIHLVF